MRLTAELLRNEVEQRTNPLRQRELCLRGFGIAILENLGAIPGLSQLDCWDLSHNRLARLENFPQTLTRLVNLQCADNAIESIDIANLSSKVPNLTTLNLSFNRIAHLHVVASLKACTKLEFLFLNGNPVTKRQQQQQQQLQKQQPVLLLQQRQEEYYRLFVIHNIPSLKVLDYVKIKQAERAKAERFAKSTAGRAYYAAAFASNGQTRTTTESPENGTVKTFVPGEGLNGSINEHDDEFGPLLVPEETSNGATTTATSNNGKVVAFTDEQKQAIRQLLANATSVKEMEEIESSVKRGILPPAAAAAILKQQQESQAAAAATTTTTPTVDETDAAASTTTGKRKDPPSAAAAADDDDDAKNGDNHENTATATTTKDVKEEEAEEREEPPQKQQKVE